MEAKKTLVSYESVAAAAESLATAGQRTSVRAVIGVLGGGSPNAVLPHLQAWKAARPSVRAADVTLDPRIAAILAEQITTAVTDATRAAEARAADLEADAEAVAEAGRLAEARSEELADQLDQIQADNQQLVGQVDAMQREFEQVKREAAAAIAEARSDAQRERDAAEQARQALARAELRLEAVPAMEQQLADLRLQLDAERKARTDAEKAGAVAVAQKEAAERQADEYRVRNTAAEQREVQLRTDLAEIAAKLESKSDKLAEVSTQAAQFAAERDAALDQVKQLNQKIAKRKPEQTGDNHQGKGD
ncbi:DNA-binding protein [Chromobacterium vaccinii]|uniref:DNA-binding protein n=1 Tax=Chromobacterium vaccinii TaxID=1108595 RepID=UPI003C75758F